MQARSASDPSDATAVVRPRHAVAVQSPHRVMNEFLHYCPARLSPSPASQGGVGSSDQCNTAMKAFSGGVIPQRFPRSFIELACDFIKLNL